jgi:DNA primase
MSVTDEIKERLDIVEVISNYVPLKKAGRNYKGLCPFHGEKTPSFVVFPDSQGWHCFGACGTGGDIFSFVMKRENLDFGEALKLLAAKAGVELQPREGPAPAAEQHLERLREIVAAAAVYFQYLLVNAGEAAIAREYLERRGLVPATWESWQLGYSLDSWDALKDQLLRKGYTLEDVEEAGLVIWRDDEGAPPAADAGPDRKRGAYDRFRGRLMIPIRDGQGRTAGFGARVLREDPARPQPKYINSPETPLFDKGSLVFGLDMARKAIRDVDLAVLVEGYMDVLMSHQVGVRNVVAGMGTALTEAQLRLIKRYSNNITLALDPDAAGDHATLRGLETARQALQREWVPVIDPRGLVRQESRLKAQLRIAALPDGLDPDELAYKDPQGWQQVIARARPIVDYYLIVVGREEDLSTARGKSNAVDRMAPLIEEIASPVERQHYIQTLARLIQTDERLVADQLSAAVRRAEREGQRERRSSTAPLLRPPQNGSATGQSPAQAAGRGAVSPPVVKYGAEELILGYLLWRPDLLSRLDGQLIEGNAAPLNAEDYSGGENRAIFGVLQAVLMARPGGEPAVPAPEDGFLDALLDRLPEELHERSLALLQRAQRGLPLTDEKLAKDVGDVLLRLREQNLRRDINQLRFLIMESEEAGVVEQLRAYHDLVVSYTAQKRHIQKLLNSRTMTGALAQSSNQMS